MTNKLTIQPIIYQGHDDESYIHDTAYTAGRVVGDIVSTGLGLVETVEGTALFLGGTTLEVTSTGTLVIPGAMAQSSCTRNQYDREFRSKSGR